VWNGFHTATFSVSIVSLFTLAFAVRFALWTLFHLTLVIIAFWFAFVRIIVVAIRFVWVVTTWMGWWWRWVWNGFHTAIHSVSIVSLFALAFAVRFALWTLFHLTLVIIAFRFASVRIIVVAIRFVWVVTTWMGWWWRWVWNGFHTATFSVSIVSLFALAFAVRFALWTLFHLALVIIAFRFAFVRIIVVAIRFVWIDTMWARWKYNMRNFNR